MDTEEFRRHAHAFVDWMADYLRDVERDDSGALYLTQNRVAGAFALRFSIGQTGTERRHVEAAWGTIQDTARSLG